MSETASERLRRHNRRSADIVLVLAVLFVAGLTGTWVLWPAQTERHLVCFGYMLTDPDAHRTLCRLPPTGAAAEIARSVVESADRPVPRAWFRPKG